jgi:hypothetical protein
MTATLAQLKPARLLLPVEKVCIAYGVYLSTAGALSRDRAAWAAMEAYLDYLAGKDAPPPSEGGAEPQETA